MRRHFARNALIAVTLWTSACGGGSESETAAPTTESVPSTTMPPIVLPTAPTTSRTTVAPPEDVEEFSVSPSHLPPETGFNYPQTPPVGGPHSPSWQSCGFYDRPVPAETAVHSLEHGAIWITYRPDLPSDEVQELRDLSRRRPDVLASRWDDGLPAPVVASSWGRQLRLQTVRDPRLDQFIRAFSGQAPEPNAPC